MENNTVHPQIISASRATDIPAFYARWLLERLKTGYCIWQNPFNARQKQKICFDRCGAIVFWSKNPEPIIPHLPVIEDLGYAFYFHFTLNDYVTENMEPALPALEKRIATFASISQMLGKKRIIWRFDPLITGGALTVPILLERIGRLFNIIAPYTEKMIFSFLEPYGRVQRNLKCLNPAFRSPDAAERFLLAKGISGINAASPCKLKLGICAAREDYSSLGILPAVCVDGALVKSIWPQYAQPAASATLPGIKHSSHAVGRKDRGQRALCHCNPSKDIGGYNSCPHGCAYCYANKSPASAFTRHRAHNFNSDIL